MEGVHTKRTGLSALHPTERMLFDGIPGEILEQDVEFLSLRKLGDGCRHGQTYRTPSIDDGEVTIGCEGFDVPFRMPDGIGKKLALLRNSRRFALNDQLPKRENGLTYRDDEYGGPAVF